MFSDQKVRPRARVRLSYSLVYSLSFLAAETDCGLENISTVEQLLFENLIGNSELIKTQAYTNNPRATAEAKT